MLAPCASPGLGRGLVVARPRCPLLSDHDDQDHTGAVQLGQTANKKVMHGHARVCRGAVGGGQHWHPLEAASRRELAAALCRHHTAVEASPHSRAILTGSVDLAVCAEEKTAGRGTSAHVDLYLAGA